MDVGGDRRQRNASRIAQARLNFRCKDVIHWKERKKAKHAKDETAMQETQRR
jgi:hypothetical protein